MTASPTDPTERPDDVEDPTATAAARAVVDHSRRPKTGDRIGPFEVIEPLGQGGMGVVFLALDPRLGRKVALKLLHAEVGDQARLEREARALGSLAHPNIVVVYEVGNEGDRLFVAMEHVRGRTLRKWTEAQAGNWREIVAMYRAVGEGLAAAHAARIVHRDFKPDNVIVGDDGRPRVLDFGLASGAIPGASTAGESRPLAPSEIADTGEINRLTRTGSILGTPRYMAPEQHMGLVADARADQFAFCVALYEALYAAPPFRGTTYPALREAVLEGRLPNAPTTDVPRAIHDVLARGLSVAPEMRFADTRALLVALDAAVAGKRRNGLALTSVALALGIAATWIVVEAARAEPEPTVAAAAPPTPAVEAPPAAPPSGALAIESVTRTRAPGIRSINADPAGTRLVYRDGDGVWIRALEGGTPLRLPIEASRTAVFALDEARSVAWIRERDALIRLPLGGAPARVAERLEPSEGIALAPGGASLLDWGVGARVWDVTKATPDSRAMAIDGLVVAAAWSLDGARFAAVIHSPDSFAPPTLKIVATANGSIESYPLPAHLQGSLAWIADDRLVIGELSERPKLACVGLRSTGLEQIGPSVELDDRTLGSQLDLVARVGSNRLLVRTLTEPRGILALARSAPANVFRTDVDLGASNRTPVWRGDDEVYFVTDRHRTPMMVRAPWNALDSITPLGDLALQSIASDGADGILARSTDGALVHRGSDGTPHATAVSEQFAKTIDSRCATPERCVGLRMGEGGSSFVRFDGVGGDERGVLPCPEGLACVPGRWALSADGARVLVVGNEGISTIELESGEVSLAARRHERIAISGATFTRDAGTFVVTGVDRDAEYVLGELRADGTWSQLWADPNAWLHAPQLSPSGDRIVAESMVRHHEAAVVELAGFCSGGSQ